MSPALTIVIPSFQGARRLPRTLRSLERQEVAGGLEILVVDDGSTEGTPDVARSFAGRLPLRVLASRENRGRGAAVNRGLREAAAPVVLILDDDMEAAPGLAARHQAMHSGSERIAALGRIVQEGLDLTDPFHAFLAREEGWRRATLLGGDPIGFEQVWTGQISLRRDDALSAGLFDETIRGYGLEDIEFAYRLGNSGVRFVYLDDAVSRHAAFMTNLDRYCLRHASVGEVAAYVAHKHDTPEMRLYLRLEPRPAPDRASLFLKLMDASASLLRRRRAAAFLAGPAWPFLRGAVGMLERAHLTRPLGFAYSVLRDIRYFDALGRARHGDSSSGSRSPTPERSSHATHGEAPIREEGLLEPARPEPSGRRRGSS